MFFDRKSDYVIDTDYAIAISWRWLINLENSAMKLIVFHDSILPKYRGFNPLVSALINGDNEIGVTALFAAKEYDVGDIIFQSSTKITYPIKIRDAINIIAENYIDLASKILFKISNNENLAGQIQNHTLASYSIWRDEDDYKINWHQDSHYIARFINAVGYPYAGAKTSIKGSLIRILDAEPIIDLEISDRLNQIGKIIFIKQHAPVIICGKGLLKLNKMEDLEGNDYKIKQFRTRLI